MEAATKVGPSKEEEEERKRATEVTEFSCCRSTTLMTARTILGIGVTRMCTTEVVLLACCIWDDSDEEEFQPQEESLVHDSWASWSSETVAAWEKNTRSNFITCAEHFEAVPVPD